MFSQEAGEIRAVLLGSRLTRHSERTAHCPLPPLHPFPPWKQCICSTSHARDRRITYPPDAVYQSGYDTLTSGKEQQRSTVLPQGTIEFHCCFHI